MFRLTTTHTRALMDTTNLVLLLILVGVLFGIVGVFPKIEFFFVRMWVRSKDPDGDIEPTPLFIVWTRIGGIGGAIALFGLAGAVFAMDYWDAREQADCEAILTPLQERLFGEDMIFEDDFTELEEEFEVRIESTHGVLDDEYYVSARVWHDDFTAVITPDTNIASTCEVIT